MKNMTCLLLAGTAALSLAACGSESAPSQTSDGVSSIFLNIRVILLLFNNTGYCQTPEQ